MFSNSLRGLLLASALVAAPTAASAQVVAEAGDAGETLATAQMISGPVTQITGQLENLGNVDVPIDDIDLYRISILNPAAFGVTVQSSLQEIGEQHFIDDDTQLFLFDATGAQLAFNDDSGGMPGYPFLSPIFKIGDFAGLAPGDYYLGFNLFYTRPNDFFTTPNDVNIASGWRRQPTPFEMGSYTLHLTGTSNGLGPPAIDEGPPRGIGAVPEPGTWALMILGFGAAGSALRRAQSRRSALRPA